MYGAELFYESGSKSVWRYAGRRLNVCGLGICSCAHLAIGRQLLQRWIKGESTENGFVEVVQ